MSNGAPFRILERLAGSDRPYQLSPFELREFAFELELHGGYQIQAWKRDADHGVQVEFIVALQEKA